MVSNESVNLEMESMHMMLKTLIVEGGVSRIIMPNKRVFR